MSWEWDDSGKWTKYPDSIARDLETAFQAGKKELEFVAPNGTSYTINFVKAVQFMTDMPDRIRSVRAVRAEGGSAGGSGAGATSGGGSEAKKAEEKVESVSVGLWFDNITGFDEPTWVRTALVSFVCKLLAQSEGGSAGGAGAGAQPRSQKQ